MLERLTRKANADDLTDKRAAVDIDQSYKNITFLFNYGLSLSRNKPVMVDAK